MFAPKVFDVSSPHLEASALFSNITAFPIHLPTVAIPLNTERSPTSTNILLTFIVLMK